jgi:hypothetical protein
VPKIIAEIGRGPDEQRQTRLFAQLIGLLKDADPLMLPTRHAINCRFLCPSASLHYWALPILLAVLLLGCAEAPTSPAPVAYATVVAFADPLNGKYDTIIALYDKPVNSQVPANRVGTVHAGEQVGVMEQRADGNVRIRTAIMEEGWTRIEALKDIRKNTP